MHLSTESTILPPGTKNFNSYNTYSITCTWIVEMNSVICFLYHCFVAFFGLKRVHTCVSGWLVIAVEVATDLYCG